MGISFILRSRESPDCGSCGTIHIRWLPFLHSGTLYEFVMRLLLGGWSFDSILHGPDHFQQVLISSQPCALARFCGIILISMPIGHWMRTIFGLVWQVSLRMQFHSPTHRFMVLSCPNLTFLLPRSACIVSMIYGWLFARIASSKVPFLTSLTSRSRFSGGS